MNVTLYMAISSDGFVAGPKGETPWLAEEWKAFSTFVRSKGNLIIGRRTFEIMKNEELHRIGDPFTVVVSRKPTPGHDDRVHHASTPLEAISILQKNGFTELVLGGGPTLNRAFLDAELIDEIILDVEAIKLGGGIKLFGDNEIPKIMQLVSERQVAPHLTQRRYSIKK